jgi:ribose transport system substrate-binding protein
MTVNDSATTSAEQADQIETLIQEKPDVLVVLPAEGEPLTPVAQKAMDQGIQVINIDREFSAASAYHTLIAGDNYGIGVQAGNFFADQLKCKGNVAEIQGIAGISVTEQRSQGFADQIKKRCNGGIKIVAQQPADFAPDKGLTVMENILQKNKDIQAVYTHDDDMGEGVASAIENAGRQDQMWMTGAGGSKAVMEKIKEGGLWRATFLYNPAMSADAVYLASLLGAGKGLPGFAAPDIPSKIILSATTVTKDNVDQFESLGF